MKYQTMQNASKPLLSQEWQILHNDHERYDKYGLLIKLTAVLACLISIVTGMSVLLGLVFIGVLWLQEGVWRTVQARTSDRILKVEEQLKHSGDQSALQFYSEWEAKRGGTAALIKEYVVNAIRPTVAYPYVILIGVDIAAALFL